MKIFLNVWNMPKYFYVFPSPLIITNTYWVLGTIISTLCLSTQLILPTTLSSRLQCISSLWLRHRNVKLPAQGNTLSACQSQNIMPGKVLESPQHNPSLYYLYSLCKVTLTIKAWMPLHTVSYFLFCWYHLYLFHCLAPINVLKSLPPMQLFLESYIIPKQRSENKNEEGQHFHIYRGRQK